MSALVTFAQSGETVTVTRADGRTSTGKVVELEDGRYKVATGQRGRPLTLDADADVTLEVAAA